MKQKIIWVFIAVLVCATAIILGVRHYQYEQYKQKLAVQAEKVVARQFVDTFTGVTEIKFTDAETDDDGAGNWALDYTFKANWKKELSSQNRNRVKDTLIGDLTESKSYLENYKLLYGFDYGTGNSDVIYEAHRGKTINKVIVIYSNGGKETLNGKR